MFQALKVGLISCVALMSFFSNNSFADDKAMPIIRKGKESLEKLRVMHPSLRVIEAEDG